MLTPWAKVGQQEDWDQVRAKAKQIGASKMIITDLRKEFIDQLIIPAIQCNAQYEGQYLLGKFQQLHQLWRKYSPIQEQALRDPSSHERR